MSVDVGSWDTPEFNAEEGAQRDSTSFGKGTNLGLDHVSKPTRRNVPGSLAAVVPETPDLADDYYLDGDQVEAAVQTQPVGARQFNAYTLTALPAAAVGYPGDPVLLVGDDGSRVRLIITNASADQTVLVGPLSQVASGAGFSLPPTQQFELQITSALYACIPVGSAKSCNVGVWVERDN